MLSPTSLNRKLMSACIHYIALSIKDNIADDVRNDGRLVSQEETFTCVSLSTLVILAVNNVITFLYVLSNMDICMY